MYTIRSNTVNAVQSPEIAINGGSYARSCMRNYPLRAVHFDITS